MHMKRTLSTLAFFCTLLAACTPQVENPPVREPAQEGEFCGGIAGFQCAEGLTCLYEGTYPDAGGTCVKE